MNAPQCNTDYFNFSRTFRGAKKEERVQRSLVYDLHHGQCHVSSNLAMCVVETMTISGTLNEGHNCTCTVELQLSP